MRAPAVARYSFRIRTRTGIVIGVQLPGRDVADAERKLRQVYRECEVIACSAPPGDDVPPAFDHLLPSAAR